MRNKSHSQTKQQKLLHQRWLIDLEQPEVIQQLATNLKILPLIVKTLINRDIYTIEKAEVFFNPESITLLSTIEEFADKELIINC